MLLVKAWREGSASALPVPLCSNPAALLFSGFLAQTEGKSLLALDYPAPIPKPVKGQ